MKRSITAQAAAFVEDAYYTAPDTRAAILSRLTEIVNERQDLAAILAGTDSPAQDFAEIDPAPSPEALAELEANTQQRRDTLAARIATLDALFLAICQATAAAGLTFSGGEISPLKRRRTPDTLAAALDALRREKIAALPAAERLEEKTARRLYTALTSAGLISGPEETFLYYLAQQSTPAAKRPEKPLSWDGKPTELAYFIDRFPRKRKRPYTRALCLAFGVDDRTRLNVVQSARTHPDEAKGTDQIDIIFNSL